VARLFPNSGLERAQIHHQSETTRSYDRPADSPGRHSPGGALPPCKRGRVAVCHRDFSEGGLADVFGRDTSRRPVLVVAAFITLPPETRPRPPTMG
jgi:hypothetical protein